MDRRWADTVAEMRCAAAIDGGTSVRQMSPEMRRKAQMWGLDLTCEEEEEEEEAVLRRAVV